MAWKPSDMVEFMRHDGGPIEKGYMDQGYTEAEGAGAEPTTTGHGPDDRGKARSSCFLDDNLSSSFSLGQGSQLAEMVTRTQSTVAPWRERDPSSDLDSTDIGIRTPAESEDSPLTDSPGSGTVMITPSVNDDMDGLDIDTSEDRSPSTFTLDTPSSADSTGSSSDDLLERPWFHHNMRRILRSLLQQWTGIRMRTHGDSDEYPGGSQLRQQTSSQQQGWRGRGKRAQQNDGVDQEDVPAKPKRRKQAQKRHDHQRFACTFPKKDLKQYQSCAKFGFTRIRDVKQHIHRNHCNDVDDALRSRLRQRSSRGRSREEQWYEIFDQLFPEHSPRPITPYNDFTLSECPQYQSHDSPNGVSIDEALYIPREYLTGEGAGILQQELVQDPVFQGLNADDIRLALSRGLTRLLEGLDQRQQQRSANRTDQTISHQHLESENRGLEQRLDNHESVRRVNRLDTNSSNDDGSRNTRPVQGHSDSLPTDEQFGGLQDEPGFDWMAGGEETEWDSGFWDPSLLAGDNWDYISDEYSLGQSSSTMPSNESHDS
ncbi:hypothetical protein FALBO_6561 [Fusarium albosuccineum]|uniref:Uncharacterized protein n=1 Tax=Fusarium albosuccineum TaxID=1237068 RepID=A0A8H4LD28_9HYPO|nr:hypothetical protein FALBO_6561 [Fusarium albosuccineum]